MLEQLPGPRRAIAVGAEREHAVGRLDRGGGAERAPRRRLRWRRAMLALGHVRRRREHLRDHIAGAQHDHILARADVLAQEVLLVVQRGHRHGLEDGEGMEVAVLADVPVDALQPGHRGRRRELPRHRPARVATHRAQPPLQLEVGDLHHGAVDLVVELAAAPLPGQALLDHLVLACQQPDFTVHAKAALAQPVERFPVGLEAQPVDHADLIAPDRQRPLRGQRGVQLAHRSGGRVARVHERRQALLGATLVQRREVLERHVDLASHLQQRRDVGDAQRDRPDRAQGVGDLLADLAVAPGSAALQLAVAVDQADREPVDLRLDHELEVRI